MINDHIQTTIATYDKTAEKFIVKVQKYAPVPEREKFISLVKSGGRILDAGCGSGRDANYFASKGFIVTGIDLSETLLTYAKAHAEKNITFLKMDLRKIDFDNASFDGIWACASVLHLKHDEVPPVLRKFYDLLVPGGTLYLLMKEGTGENMVTSGTIEGNTRFFMYYSVDEIKSLLGSAGFSILETFTWDQKDRHAERPHEIWISTFAKRQAYERITMLPR